MAQKDRFDRPFPEDKQWEAETANIPKTDASLQPFLDKPSKETGTAYLSGPSMLLPSVEKERFGKIDEAIANQKNNYAKDSWLLSPLDSLRSKRNINALQQLNTAGHQQVNATLPKMRAGLMIGGIGMAGLLAFLYAQHRGAAQAQEQPQQYMPPRHWSE